MRLQTEQKGFTLVELLVVISIIGLLSTLAVVSLNSARSKARDARRLSDVKQIQTALELYRADRGVYPQRSEPITLGVNGARVICDHEQGFRPNEDDCDAVYMGQVPSNFNDPATAGYAYQSANEGNLYQILFEVESTIAGLSGTLLASPSGITEQ